MSLVETFVVGAAASYVGLLAFRGHWPQRVRKIWRISKLHGSWSDKDVVSSPPAAPAETKPRFNKAGARFISAISTGQVSADELRNVDVQLAVREALKMVSDKHLNGLTEAVDEKYANPPVPYEVVRMRSIGLSPVSFAPTNDLGRLAVLIGDEKQRRKEVKATLEAGTLLREAMQATLDDEAKQKTLDKAEI